MTALLDELERARSFALLGPGFHDDGAWTLVRDLRAGDDGEVGVWLATYETPGERAERFTGEVARVESPLGAGPQGGNEEAPSPASASSRGPGGAAGAERASAALAVTLDERGFVEGVRSIREAIAAGDVYQVNLTLRARVERSTAGRPRGGSPGVDGGALLERLCERGVPRFAAWVRLPDGRELVSASPELLFEVRGHSIRAEPMKGTAPAGQQAWLEGSEKDRAELAMITDLLRDDLNRLCEPRSVEVPCARRFLELPYAVQAVSDVTGRLRAGVGLRAVLGQLHPGGSVTGAPREAARALISKLEQSPRGAYCGTLGLERAGASRFALLIRTAERSADGSWVYGVGGGITWDSDEAAELDEVRLKLGALR
ncbi:MAG: chorismate-binding protein [Myxococcota bacterium]